jgi:hypothetical protein
VGHQHGAVGVRVGLLQVVGGEQDGLAAGGELAHGPPEAVAALDVHCHSRLVEHQQGRVADDRHGEAHALGLPAGELLRALAGDLAQAGELQHLVHLQRLWVQRGHHLDQLAHGQVADQRARLQHRADRPPSDGLAGPSTEHRHRALVGLEQAEEHVDRGRLAGAVGTEQGDGLTRRDAHVHAPHGADRPRGSAEGLDQPAQLDLGAPGARRGLGQRLGHRLPVGLVTCAPF